jgi:hypothetical protein
VCACGRGGGVESCGKGVKVVSCYWPGSGSVRRKRHWVPPVGARMKAWQG